MRYRWLGSTGLRISEVGFGAWAIGGKWWGPQDDTDSVLALHEALDRGCNFIDTAWVYGDGHSERLIGGVLKNRNQQVVVATKAPPKNWDWNNKPGTPLSEAFPPEWVEKKAEESLKRLGVSCLDVLQLHTWSRDWNSQAGPLLDAVARMKRAGKIRAFGISLRDKGAGEANDLVKTRQVDVLQVFFNLLYQEPITELFPLTQAYGTGVIARVPLAFGALTNRFNARTRFTGDDHRRNLYSGERLKRALAKAQALSFLTKKGRSLGDAALKWTLAFPAVSVTIPGIRNPRQARLNLAAGEGSGLTAGEVKRTQTLYASNFGLPLFKIATAEDVPAVFMSDAKIREKVQKSKPPVHRAKTRKPKSNTPRAKARPKRKGR